MGGREVGNSRSLAPQTRPERTRRAALGMTENEVNTEGTPTESGQAPGAKIEERPVPIKC